jgi:hypothetical protein
MWLSRFLVALIVVAFFTQAESQQPAVLADETRSYEISSRLRISDGRRVVPDARITAYFCR